MEGISILRANSVQLRTLRLYHDAWEDFRDWCARVSWDIRSAPHLDEALMGYFDFLAEEGQHVATGRRVLASVVFFRNDLGRGRFLSLTGAKQCFKGWARLTPDRSRLPLP